MSTFDWTIVEEQEKARRAWAAATAASPRVKLVTGTPATLLAMQGVDAALMLGMFAHERYGGRPIEERSQVLPTRSAVGPRFVVTPPARAGRLERVLEKDGTSRMTVVPERPLVPEDQTRFAFEQVMAAVNEHNRTYPQDAIRAIGFSPEFIGFDDHVAERARGFVAAITSSR